MVTVTRRRRMKGINLLPISLSSWTSGRPAAFNGMLPPGAPCRANGIGAEEVRTTTGGTR